MTHSKTIRVEVAYARPDRQVIVPVEVELGATMHEAVVRSRIADQFAPGEIDADTIPMGIFSKLEQDPKARALADGERVELYRPLLADPNGSRKERAQKTKQKRDQDAG